VLAAAVQSCCSPGNQPSITAMALLLLGLHMALAGQRMPYLLSMAATKETGKKRSPC
jgi:hypothetical protein